MPLPSELRTEPVTVVYDAARLFDPIIAIASEKFLDFYIGIDSDEVIEISASSVSL